MADKSKKYVEPAKPVGTVAELFAGVGGFRIGLARAGWKTVRICLTSLNSNRLLDEDSYLLLEAL